MEYRNLYNKYVKKIERSLKSLQIYYGKRNLKNNTIKMIDAYCSSMSDSDLLKSFESFFHENPSFFGIEKDIRTIYEMLLINYYHNEAFLKSKFINYLKRKKSVTFFELPVNKSRVDLCSINGRSCAYEIKTKYDSLIRLNKQLNDYLLAFEYVYVICSSNRTGTVLKTIPECVGVYSYNDNSANPRFILVKEAKLSNSINSEVQLSILRKKEKQLLKNTADSSKINHYFKNCLRKRYQEKWDDFIVNMKNYNLLDYQYKFNSLL